jgi:hypothetical protein
MSNAGPVVVSMNAGACNLVKFLQLAAANLADNSVFNLDLGVVAKHNYHSSDDPLKRLKPFAFYLVPKMQAFIVMGKSDFRSWIDKFTALCMCNGPIHEFIADNRFITEIRGVVIDNYK